MLASRPAATTLLRPVLWVGSMTDVRPAAEVAPGEEDLRGEASASQFVRVAALAVVSLTAVLAAIELGRLALATASASHAGWHYWQPIACCRCTCDTSSSGYVAFRRRTATGYLRHWR